MTPFQLRRASLVAALLAACAPARPPSLIEDRARQLVPVPVCVEPLPRRPAAGTRFTPTPDEYRSLFGAPLPSQVPSATPAPEASSEAAGTCKQRAARYVGSFGVGTAGVLPDPVVVNEDAGLELLWLPATQVPRDGEANGIVVLLRIGEERIEVYGIGPHEGSPSASRLQLERLGPLLALSSTEEHCEEARGPRLCQAMTGISLLLDGSIIPAARFPTERHRRVPAPSGGVVWYGFNVSVEFGQDAVRLVEKLVAKTPGGEELMSSEFPRELRRLGMSLVPSAPSLWSKVLPE